MKFRNSFYRRNVRDLSLTCLEQKVCSSPIFFFSLSLSLVLKGLRFCRFDDATLRVLESALVSKDVKSSIEVRSGLRQFLRSESLSVLREISEKSAEEKLLVLEFLVRSFALVGDVEASHLFC